MSDMYMCVKNWKGYRKGKLYECVDYNNGINIYDDFGELGVFHTYGTISPDESVQCPVMYAGEYIHGRIEVFRNEDYKIKDWMVIKVYFIGDPVPLQFHEKYWSWVLDGGAYRVRSRDENREFYLPVSSIKYIEVKEVSE